MKGVDLSMSNVLIATERKEGGRKTRQLGYVPANIYGPGIEHNLNIQFDESDISKFLRSNAIGSKAKVKVNKDEWDCIVKEIQYQILGGGPIHVDFYATSADVPVRTKLGISLIGNEQLIRNNLVLNVTSDEIEIQGLMKDLPGSIEIDVSDMQSGDVITMGDIALPNGVTLISNPDEVVAAAGEGGQAPEEDVTDEETPMEVQPDAEVSEE